jgi:alcohol dehydrogenase (cytochrome c)
LKKVLAALALLVVAAVAASIALVPDLAWRARLVKMQALGQIQDLGWIELARMLAPGSGYYLLDLSDTGNPYASIVNIRNTPADVAAGAQLYRARCSVCHGAEGAGGAVGPALNRPTASRKDSDWALYRTITRGVPGTQMEGQRLKDAEVWQAIAFIRSVQHKGTPPADPQMALSETIQADVTAARLADARGEPGNWLTYSGAYDGWRYSALAQIDRGNAQQLQLKWMVPTEAGDGLFEATPIVDHGLMFVSDPPEQVHALAAATGQVIWTWRRPVPPSLPLCCGRVNRGVAVLGDRLAVGTVDAHLIALDARTGKQLWDATVADAREGYSITSAPLAVKGLFIVGVAGGEYGARGFLDAYDAKTGQRVWRFYTVPGPGEAGHDSWQGDSWRTGGGGTWLTGSYDPRRNLLYWGVGNPSPNYNGDQRGGDNLYTASVIALDADTGKLRWHFQFTPHDLRDWDSNQIPVLVDAPWEGRERPLLLWANRNGFFYVLDRETGQFLKGQPYVEQTWASGLTAGGRPILNQAALPTAEGVVGRPSIYGGTNWQSPTYSPSTGLFNVPFFEGARLVFKDREPPKHEAGQPFWGGLHQSISSDDTFYTGIRAIDPATGTVRWEHRNKPRKEWWRTGGLLSTAGNIIFTGDDRELYVVDATNGAELWRVGVGGRVNANPVTYLVNGEQRVTIAAGRMLLTFGLPASAPAGK